ncbi:proteoglycan 4b isoform X4 [Rhinichthys klamathensis goyatoka]|uniref:proteoglycan 4b isoform X4 n=1 Tax=Rhinichthys klamathensis goyatoka TaxID=3034132 RepID=UPI0024B5282A|nr:proteoglycan 4b isoform X4 [Rhinichthys klamathensis goyatoka]
MATYLSLLLLFACASTSSSNPNSCEGRCGEGYYRGSFCQCDYECLGLNECCTDFQNLCTTKDSCKGRCGEPFNRGNPCHCDIDCVPYSQCCPDYEGMCLMEDTALKSRNTDTAAQRTANLCLNIKNKKSTESSNEEMTNEEGIGDELMIPEDESESTPSEGPDADASSMLHADENPIESTTQQPSEMTTSSTPQPQETASTAPTEGPTSTAPTKDPTSAAPTEGPTSMLPTEGPTSTAPTEGPTSTAPTEGPTSTAPTEGPTSTAPTEGPTSTAPPEGPTSTAPTESQTSTAPTEGPTSTAPTEGPTSTAPTEGPTSTAPTEGPTSTAPTESQTSTAPTEGPTSTAPTEGPTSTAPTESPTSTAPTEGPTSTAPTEGPTSTAPTEGPTSTAPTESQTSTAPTEGPTSAAPTDGSTRAAPTEGPTIAIPSNGPASAVPKGYSVTEMTMMSLGEDPKESSSLKDSRATSVPKTTSTPAPVKPTKRTIQPSTHKNDKSDGIKDYQADDYDTNLCSGRPVSGLTTLRNGTIVVFRGHYFWTLDKYRNPDPPQLITRVWGIPSPIDTVYTRCNCLGKTYFFKGKDYWRFDNGMMDHGFPKPVSQGFGQIGRVTAALSIPEYRSRKESVIFFKRGGLAQKYTYQVTPKCGKRIPVYPARTRARRQAAAALGQMINISKNWKGFPTRVTSAVSVPSRVKEGYKYYVFSQRKYYSIKMEREKPVILKPATGPKENSASSFFKCQETQKN